MNDLKPWHISALFHLTFFTFFAVLLYLPKQNSFIEVPIEIYQPNEIQNLTSIEQQPKVVLKSVNEAKSKPIETREIFGASRDSYTDLSAGSEAIDVKKGNTLTKDVDNLELKDSDATQLPTPTEEYLVSEMPVVISEVRPIYPKEAKDKQLEGSVSLDVLIDDQGFVRQVKVIEGLDIFKTGALEAMRKFKFKPAKVDGKSVAVRIRYVLNFRLEY
jgi:periplasmic protein TonB